MTIKPAPIPDKKEPKPKDFWFNTLLEFLSGDKDCIELVPDPQEYKSIRSLQSTVCAAIHKYNFAISTSRVDGRLYLVKKIRGNGNGES